MATVRKLLRLISIPIIHILKPCKLFAYRTRSVFIRRLILEISIRIDFILVFMNIQNETMELHWKIYKGNFIFGNGVMVTNYNLAVAGITKPMFKNNNFMGVGIVSSASDAFATNTGILQQNPPIRQLTRKYIDDNIFTGPVMAMNYDSIKNQCGEILKGWESDPKMANTVAIRSAVIQMTFRVLTNKTIDKEDADDVTFQYMKGFVELSLFKRYFPFMCGMLGTAKHIRKDAYFKLKDYGIDIMTIDMTLFAALFSIGTLVIRCVENCARYDISYGQLDEGLKRNFIIESVRLYPTVTAINRIVEKDEEVYVCNQTIKMTAGDEIIYPLLCVNQDPAHFNQPDQLKLDRPDAEYEKTLSWSKGQHDCPGKELSIILTRIMLDSLDEKLPLKNQRIFNPAF